ncbi:MAG: glutamate-5-semialdehyde dehydrogenase [Bacteroidales bacterium]|jgi:glutamate-5-semialdehyde dehydrogenase|nr:glutamate-5-semialdehyde dehydrogenase [Bacteroidales bacterium]
MDYLSIFRNVKQASRHFDAYAQIDDLLNHLADLLEAHTDQLLAANQLDLNRLDPNDPKYDRLKLTDRRIAGIAGDMRNVATLPSPLGVLLSETERPNGLKIAKISVPIGVIGIIYEARPNVTCDVFSLCLKSGNGCVLKGGSDAQFSNKAIVGLIHQVLEQFHISKDMVVLLPPERESTGALLGARGLVDMVIPRGGQQLIHFVCENAKIPVIETGAGIVHTYLDESGESSKASLIINNAKTRRVSVCNALDCLIVHRNKLRDLAIILNPLADSQVVLYADEPACQHLYGRYPADLLQHATESSFGTEFLDYKMAVKTVDNIEEALAHIEHYGSGHSEAIISTDDANIEMFLSRVDAAAVYVNSSTAFTDGAQFGLGAEIGISTQKLHARGPMGLNNLTSYKWVVRGTGQIRSN